MELIFLVILFKSRKPKSVSLFLTILDENGAIVRKIKSPSPEYYIFYVTSDSIYSLLLEKNTAIQELTCYSPNPNHTFVKANVCHIKGAPYLVVMDDSGYSQTISLPDLIFRGDGTVSKSFKPHFILNNSMILASDQTNGSLSFLSLQKDDCVFEYRLYQSDRAQLFAKSKGIQMTTVTRNQKMDSVCKYMNDFGLVERKSVDYLAADDKDSTNTAPGTSKSGIAQNIDKLNER